MRVFEIPCLSLWFVLSNVVLSTLSPAQSSIRCWGDYGYDTEGRRGRFVQVDAGFTQTAVLRDDGRIFVNGQNDFNPLGVPPLPAGLRYTQVSVNTYGGAAVRSDGEVVTWGINTFVLGHPPMYPPTPPLPAGLHYTQVSASRHVLALRSDGDIVAWGDNVVGQCNVPPLPSGVVAAKVRAMGSSSFAILSDGAMLAWGMTPYGPPPILPAGVGYLDVSQSNTHCVAVRSDGQLEAWGTNQYGELNVPPLPAGVTYVLASAGSGNTLALRSDGALAGWGLNHVGQCTAPQIPSGARWLQIDSGQFHSVGLLSNGEVLTWGANALECGFVPTLPERTVGDLTPHYRLMARGWGFTIAVTSSGKIQEWTGNSVPSGLNGNDIALLKAEFVHHGALLRDGRLVCWGDNSQGQCNVPPLPPGVRYTDFALGEWHTVAVRSDGNAVAFGSPSSGATTIPQLPPGVTYVGAEAEFGKTMLLRSDGSMVSWGAPQSPSLHVVPPLPPGVAYVQAAAARTSFTLVLRSDGIVAVCGALPTGLPTDRPIPPLPWGLYYVEVACGEGHAALRRSDGQVFGAGGCFGLLDLVPPLDPGTSYVQISANFNGSAARVGPTSTYIGVAPGCAGSMQPARLVPRDTPRIGAPLQVTVFDLPVDVAMLAMSLQRLPAPLSLAPFGMPGCDWHVPLDAVALLAGQANHARFTLPIPRIPELVGVRFFHQALVLDPAAGNGFGAVVSDAAEGVIGR